MPSITRCLPSIFSGDCFSGKSGRQHRAASENKVRQWIQEDRLFSAAHPGRKGDAFLQPFAEFTHGVRGPKHLARLENKYIGLAARKVDFLTSEDVDLGRRGPIRGLIAKSVENLWDRAARKKVRHDKDDIALQKAKLTEIVNDLVKQRHPRASNGREDDFKASILSFSKNIINEILEQSHSLYATHAEIDPEKIFSTINDTETARRDFVRHVVMRIMTDKHQSPSEHLRNMRDSGAHSGNSSGTRTKQAESPLARMLRDWVMEKCHKELEGAEFWRRSLSSGPSGHETEASSSDRHARAMSEPSGKGKGRGKDHEAHHADPRSIELGTIAGGKKARENERSNILLILQNGKGNSQKIAISDKKKELISFSLEMIDSQISRKALGKNFRDSLRDRASEAVETVLESTDEAHALLRGHLLYFQGRYPVESFNILADSVRAKRQFAAFVADEILIDAVGGDGSLKGRIRNPASGELKRLLGKWVEMRCNAELLEQAAWNLHGKASLLRLQNDRHAADQFGAYSPYGPRHGSGSGAVEPEEESETASLLGPEAMDVEQPDRMIAVHADKVEDGDHEVLPSAPSVAGAIEDRESRPATPIPESGKRDHGDEPQAGTPDHVHSGENPDFRQEDRPPVSMIPPRELGQASNGAPPRPPDAGKSVRDGMADVLSRTTTTHGRLSEDRFARFGSTVRRLQPLQPPSEP